MKIRTTIRARVTRSADLRCAHFEGCNSSRLERFIMGELFVHLVIGVVLYVGAFLLMTLLERGPWLSTLPMSGMLRWLAYQAPDFAVRSFPLSLVLSVLLVFSRLAREGELLAVYAGGVSLSRLGRPAFALGFVLSGIGLALTEFVVPQTNTRVAVTWWDSVNGGGRALAFLTGKQIAIDNFLIHFEDFDPVSDELQRVRLEFWEGRRQTVYWALAGRLQGNRLSLRGYQGYTLDHERLMASGDPSDALVLSNVPSTKEGRLTYQLGKNREQLISDFAGGGFEDSRSISKLYLEWRASTGIAGRKAAALLGLKTALPFANVVILLLVIPIAGSTGRSSSSAFGLAVLVAIASYTALHVGETLSLHGLAPGPSGPWLGLIGLVVPATWKFWWGPVR